MAIVEPQSEAVVRRIELLYAGQAYVLEGDLAVLRTIAVGAVSVSEVEVVSGLDAEDLVLQGPDLHRVEENARVIPGTSS